LRDLEAIIEFFIVAVLPELDDFYHSFESVHGCEELMSHLVVAHLAYLGRGLVLLELLEGRDVFEHKQIGIVLLI
jgi:hypothetical protein